jgi:hypothetical protein
LSHPAEQGAHRGPLSLPSFNRRLTAPR